MDAIAAPSGQEDDDPLRESKAYNESIYFMVAMPYLILGGFGWVVYRSIKANRQKPSSEPPDDDQAV
ncbi:MAG TPA: hypothetical protein VG013_13995 [Gemmataceae bacterium]|nr:hypothetical protein [Gemmataceae bacterium]